jgi:diguanylate cyclase (GGDEF)-like protein
VHSGALHATGVTEFADAGVITLCAVRAARAPDRSRATFWRLLAIAFCVLALGYTATAVSRWQPAAALTTLGVAAVLAAYPFLLAALCVRAVQEEGFEGGLATFCDVGMLVAALLAACLPVVLPPLGSLGTGQAAAAGLTWVGNVGLFAGGVWLLYRLPARRRAGGVVLMVAALGLFSLVSLVDIVSDAHGGPPRWQVGMGYGACYLLLALAPRRDIPRTGQAEPRVQESVSWRVLLPYLALLPLIVLWCLGAVRAEDTRALAAGIIAVSLLALTRQILLLREHQAVAGAERMRVREQSLMQEVARTLASTLELDAVLAEVVRASSAMMSPAGSRRCIATVLRLEGGIAVSLAQHDQEGLASFSGTRYPLATHPMLARAVATGCMESGQMAETAMSATTAVAVQAAGLRAWAVAPLHVGGSVYGLLTVSVRDRQGLEEVQLQRLGGIVSLAEMAISNALSYARQRDAASTDPLTGLRNRRYFEEQLDALPRAAFAVLAVDVDCLKMVNDEYGHEAGDDILRAVARTLSGLVRAGDVLARVGGDEFALLLHNTDESEAECVAERMQQAMQATSVRRGTPRISVGCAAGTLGRDVQAVRRRADEALYRAKRLGRDRVEGATGGGGARRTSSRAAWAQLLAGVLAGKTLRAVYQPIVRLEDRSVVGYEALARLRGMSADEDVEELFATAKSLGLLRDLDWLGRRVGLAGAQRLLAPGTALFINVSSVALLDPVHEVDQMLLLCRWAGRSPDEVVLEITEREAIPDVGRLRGVLAAHREHGFRFALDDVGDGHSTLEVLTAARPEFVKVARSLVLGTKGDASTATIRATVEFTRTTGGEVVAEGIETDLQAELMARLGVTCGQGWLFGRPSPLPPLPGAAAWPPRSAQAA